MLINIYEDIYKDKNYSAKNIKDNTRGIVNEISDNILKNVSNLNDIPNFDKYLRNTNAKFARIQDILETDTNNKLMLVVPNIKSEVYNNKGNFRRYLWIIMHYVLAILNRNDEEKFEKYATILKKMKPKDMIETLKDDKLPSY